MDSQILTFVWAAAVLTLTPGADTMLVLRNVLQGGRRQGVVTAFGICSGLSVHAFLAACGVSVILMQSATIFSVLKTLGGGYLIWIGARSVRRAIGKTGYAAWTIGNESRRISVKNGFFEGFLTDVLNPKVAVFYLAFLPQFIKATDVFVLKSIILAGIHCGLSVIWLILLSLFMDHSRRLIMKNSIRRWLDGFCGTIFIGLGLRLFYLDR